MVNESSQSTESRSTLLRSTLIFSGLCIVLLHVYAGLVPSGANWGFHHLGFFSSVIRIPVLALMLLFLLAPVQSYSLRWVTAIAHRLATLKRTTRISLLLMSAVLLAIVFWLGRQRTFFLGDGYLVLRNLRGIAITEGIPGAFPRPPFFGLIAWTVYRALDSLAVPAADRYAVQAISVLFGTCCVFLIWRLSKSISADPLERILVALFMLSGISQLFFGYVETYTAVFAAFLLYVLLAIMYLSGRGHINVVAVAYGLLLAMHVGMVVILPSFVFILYVGYKRSGLLSPLQSLLSVMLTFGVLLWLSGYTILSFRYLILMRDPTHLVPWLALTTENQAYTMFQPAHVLDLANLWLLLSPFTPLVLMLVMILHASSFIKNREALFMVIIAVCGAAFTIFCNADVGMARDWDVFSLFGFGAVILAAYGWVRQPEDEHSKHRLLVMMVALTFFHSVPWILLNSDDHLSRLRFETIIDRRFFSKNAIRYAYEELAIFHRERKEFAEAATYYEKCLELYPGHQRILQNLKKMYDSLDVHSEKDYIFTQDSAWIRHTKPSRDSTSTRESIPVEGK